MAHILFSIIVFIVRLLPYPLYRLLAAPFVGAAFLFSRKLHRNAFESLTIAFGDSLPAQEKRRIARVSFFSLAWGLVDLLYYIARPQAAKGRFDVQGMEYLERARQAGKGVIMVVAHLGPFAAMLSKFICEGYPVKVVMHSLRSKAWRQELVAHPEMLVPQPVFSAPLRECVVECFRVLKANELLVMPIDQNYGGPGRVFVDFFGRKAATAAGPAGYAVKTGAALLTAFARPVKAGHWKIVVEPVVWDAAMDERLAVRHLTQVMTSRVEAEARAFPEEWSWMHRRWKAVPKENE
ncbi:MAG: lysophospholipid acyltransferase family protein [Candidatus Omnitrophica bacterium]|nr:lysophospholipid acyltransferase family protein [Candidatus Omnitrophota bacterium]